MRSGRTTLLILGAALIITGTIWIFQGIGILKGSFMTGQAFWAWMGLIAVMVGLPLLVRGISRRQPR